MFSSRRPSSRRRIFVFRLSLSKRGHVSIACIGVPILAPHAHFLSSLGTPFQRPVSDSTGNPLVLARSNHQKSSVYKLNSMSSRARPMMSISQECIAWSAHLGRPLEVFQLSIRSRKICPTMASSFFLIAIYTRKLYFLIILYWLTFLDNILIFCFFSPNSYFTAW